MGRPYRFLVLKETNIEQQQKISARVSFGEFILDSLFGEDGRQWANDDIQPLKHNDLVEWTVSWGAKLDRPFHITTALVLFKWLLSSSPLHLLSVLSSMVNALSDHPETSNYRILKLTKDTNHSKGYCATRCVILTLQFNEVLLTSSKCKQPIQTNT